jgi:hypothetical protein
MSDLVPALKSEEAQLLSELRGDPRFRKLERIQELLRDYESPMDRALGSGALPFPAPLARPSPAQALWPDLASSVNGRTVSKQDRVKGEIRNLLTKKQVAHRKEILAHLVAIGVMGHEKDPMASLAAYLSTFKEDFVFDGNGNYSLKPG